MQLEQVNSELKTQNEKLKQSEEMLYKKIENLNSSSGERALEDRFLVP